MEGQRVRLRGVFLVKLTVRADCLEDGRPEAGTAALSNPGAGVEANAFLPSGVNASEHEALPGTRAVDKHWLNTHTGRHVTATGYGLPGTTAVLVGVCRGAHLAWGCQGS